MKSLSLLLGLVLYLVTSPALAVMNVFTCEPEWKALVEALGGEHVKAYSATTAFQDPHYIEARPSLIAKVRRADLLVCTGAELEVGWLPLLLRQSGNSAIQVNERGYFLAADQVKKIGIPEKLDRSEGDLHASGNPHIHWSPYRVLKVAKALSSRLIAIDPEHTDSYENLYATFERRWSKQINIWEAQAENLKGIKVIVYHKSWNYLLNWLGIEAAGDLEPKPGIPPTSSHLANLLDLARHEEIKFILITNYQDSKGAQWLSHKTGIPILRLPYTVGGSKEATDIFALYDEVIATLTGRLQGKPSQ